MTLDARALQERLCERLCEDVRVERRPDGALMLLTRFQFPDGDRFPIRLSEAGPGGIRLSDGGHTLMRLGYEHDVDSFLDGTRGALLERILAESGARWDGGAFCLDTPAERLPEAIFRFGQALTRVHDLTLLSRANSHSTFYEDLADLLSHMVDEDKIRRDYEPEAPNARDYRVDYRIEGKDGVPLFLYGVHNRDKARLTTIMLGHFLLHGLAFESILVFENQTEIPRRDLARLSNVGGDMISSLESRDDLDRKLRRRVAA